VNLAQIRSAVAEIFDSQTRKTKSHGQRWKQNLTQFTAWVLLLNKFFPIVDTGLSCEDIARQSCAMVPRWPIFGDFLRPAFSASRTQHVSDLHSKFALGPHHVSKYGRHPISDR